MCAPTEKCLTMDKILSILSAPLRSLGVKYEQHFRTYIFPRCHRCSKRVYENIRALRCVSHSFVEQTAVAMAKMKMEKKIQLSNEI